MKQHLTQTMSLLLLFGAISIQQLHAKPANPAPYTITLRDGTQLTLRTIGDEFYHYTITSEGYTVLNTPQGDYFYAQLNNQGELVATKIPARPSARLTTTERAQLQRIGKQVKPYSTKDLNRRMAFRNQGTPLPQMSSVAGVNPPGLLSGTTAPSKGELKSLVILVETADAKFTIPTPRQTFSNMLSQDGYSQNGATGSAWNYYQDNSNKQFNPQFVFAGPYQVSHPTAYYAGEGGVENVAELVIEACVLADPEINFAEFSSDGQSVRDIFIFYAGYSQADGGGNHTIWPHRSNIADEDSPIIKYLDGVQIKGYACGSEYRGELGSRNMDGISTFCHEFGHVLGWPDFYDTDYEESGGNALGAYQFSLMANGTYNNEGRTPPASSLLERWMLGWATPTELSEEGAYTLPPIPNNEGYLIRTKSDTEYFLIEYRGSGVNNWDNSAYIYNAQGMIVYHIDYSRPSVWQNNTINVNPAHEYMKIVRVDPNRLVFPSTTNATELSSEKITDYRAWDGSTMSVVLNDIKLQNGKAITFRVVRQKQIQQFKAHPYAQDAILTWVDPKSDSWLVTWGNEVEKTKSRTVNKPEAHLSGLTPKTDYQVTITPLPISQDKEAQDFKFTTTGLNENMIHKTIAISEYEHSSTTPILLAINTNEPTTVKWYIDGQPSTSNYRTLPVGEHKITAEITNEEGDKEYIIKYIQVK